MPSRRISAAANLAPFQEIAVNPYSGFNSDNVNMLTRIVTGKKDEDFVVSGLDAYGVNQVNSEVTRVVPLPEKSIYTSEEFNSIWPENKRQNVELTPDGKVSTIKVDGATSVRATLIHSQDLDVNWIGRFAKITIELSGHSPKALHISVGSETKTLERPGVNDEIVAYMQIVDHNAVFNPLTINIDVDQYDKYYHGITQIEKIEFAVLENRGLPIEPLRDPTIPEDNIPEQYLHPHKSITVNPGVCIKDETMVNITGAQLTQPETPVITLEYGNNNSWIKGEAFTASDFEGSTYLSNNDGSYQEIAFDDNGLMTTASLDDGQDGGPRKVCGDSRESNTNRPHIQWAYICVYYSYFKHVNPNKAYIGLAKQEEIDDARYGEDYLILGKLRFIDRETVDTIIYYPLRKDWGFIDATKVTYDYLSNLKHWTVRPINVSRALDLLAYEIYHMKGCLYFQTHKLFEEWKARRTPCGYGHGPRDYLKRINGQDPENSYDLLAYVCETNTFWKSRLEKTWQIDDIKILDGGSGYAVNDQVIVSTDRTSVPYDHWQYTAVTATVKSVNSTGAVTDITISDNGRYKCDIDTTVSITSANGTGFKGIAVMHPVKNGYDNIIVWEELQLKTFEVDWSNENSGQWPATIPSDWRWSESGETAPTAIDDVKAQWPHKYYLVMAPGGSFRKVNPFNPHGTGTVPAPVTSEIVKNKFLRADGTWQRPQGNSITLENYDEFYQWFNHESYTWHEGRVQKQGCLKSEDFGILIHIASDNQWFRSPQNPEELSSSSADYDPSDAWGTWNTESPSRDNVPNEIKPINNVFELKWETWPNSIPTDWQWSVNNVNGPTSIDIAKAKWPDEYYFVTSVSDNHPMIVNPFNPLGKNEVPGPEIDDVKKNKFLRADATWQNVRSGTIIFENYYEFYLWFTSSGSYKWRSPTSSEISFIEKVARIPETDYDALIFVVEDSQWWRCPQNPSEYNPIDTTDPKYVSIEDSWGNWKIYATAPSSENDVTRYDVANSIKPINNTFEVNWRKDGGWPIDSNVASNRGWQWTSAIAKLKFGDSTLNPGDLISILNPGTGYVDTDISVDNSGVYTEKYPLLIIDENGGHDASGYAIVDHTDNSVSSIKIENGGADYSNETKIHIACRHQGKVKISNGQLSIIDPGSGYINQPTTISNSINTYTVSCTINHGQVTDITSLNVGMTDGDYTIRSNDLFTECDILLPSNFNGGSLPDNESKIGSSSENDKYVIREVGHGYPQNTVILDTNQSTNNFTVEVSTSTPEYQFVISKTKNQWNDYNDQCTASINNIPLSITPSESSNYSTHKITIINAGSNYTTGNANLLCNGTKFADGSITVNSLTGSIISLTLTSGDNYPSGNITIQQNSNESASATIVHNNVFDLTKENEISSNKIIKSINIINTGSGYNKNDKLEFTATINQQIKTIATASVHGSEMGAISEIILSNPGSNYHPDFTTVELTGGSGSGASAVPIFDSNNNITGISLINRGRGYTSNNKPTVSINYTNTTAFATTTIDTNGTISLGNLTSGHGYSTGNVTMEIVDPDGQGSGAIIQWNVSNDGSIVISEITSGGTGYSDGTVIKFIGSRPNGSINAQATCGDITTTLVISDLQITYLNSLKNSDVTLESDGSLSVNVLTVTGSGSGATAKAELLPAGVGPFDNTNITVSIPYITAVNTLPDFLSEFNYYNDKYYVKSISILSNGSGVQLQSSQTLTRSFLLSGKITEYGSQTQTNQSLYYNFDSDICECINVTVLLTALEFTDDRRPSMSYPIIFRNENGIITDKVSAILAINSDSSLYKVICKQTTSAKKIEVYSTFGSDGILAINGSATADILTTCDKFTKLDSALEERSNTISNTSTYFTKNTIVQKINVNKSGNHYGNTQIEFSCPTLSGGKRAFGHITGFNSSGGITEITIDDGGLYDNDEEITATVYGNINPNSSAKLTVNTMALGSNKTVSSVTINKKGSGYEKASSVAYIAGCNTQFYVSSDSMHSIESIAIRNKSYKCSSDSLTLYGYVKNPIQSSVNASCSVTLLSDAIIPKDNITLNNIQSGETAILISPQMPDLKTKFVKQSSTNTYNLIIINQTNSVPSDATFKIIYYKTNYKIFAPDADTSGVLRRQLTSSYAGSNYDTLNSACNKFYIDEYDVNITGGRVSSINTSADINTDLYNTSESKLIRIERTISSSDSNVKIYNINNSKQYFPYEFFIIKTCRGTESESDVRFLEFGNAYYKIVNPFNPTGFGFVDGPSSSEIKHEKVLTSTGSWKSFISPGTVALWFGYFDAGNIQNAIELKDNPGWLIMAGQAISFQQYPLLFEQLIKVFHSRYSGSICYLPNMLNRIVIGNSNNDRLNVLTQFDYELVKAGANYSHTHKLKKGQITYSDSLTHPQHIHYYSHDDAGAPEGHGFTSKELEPSYAKTFNRNIYQNAAEYYTLPSHALNLKLPLTDIELTQTTITPPTTTLQFIRGIYIIKT